MSNVLPRIIVNGVLSSDVNVMDRGFQYGDGVFETMLIVNQQIPLWGQHWLRLTKGCDALAIVQPKKEIIENSITELTKGISKGVIKLIVTRGIGGRGYAATEQLEPEFVLIQTDYPQYPESHWQEGVDVRICNTRLAHQPALAGVKHMNRLEQVLARTEWTDSNIAEGIMLDIQDNVIEGTMSNLFMVKNNTVYTPGLNLCGVLGVMRETVLSILSEEQITYEVTKINQDMLKDADEVFLTNSVIGLWPVKKIGVTVYQVGPIAKDIQLKINKIINA